MTHVTRTHKSAKYGKKDNSLGSFVQSTTSIGQEFYKLLLYFYSVQFEFNSSRLWNPSPGNRLEMLKY